MGNHVARAYANSRATTPTVIFPGGEAWHLKEPAKAAEIMLESPGFFLVDSDALHIGKRLSAVAADDELAIAKIYVMFPMGRRNSTASATDMAVALMTTNSSARRRISRHDKARVLPHTGEAPDHQESPVGRERRTLGELLADAGSHSKADIMEDKLASAEIRPSMTAFRSKKPLLETIHEEPPPSIWSRYSRRRK